MGGSPTPRAARPRSGRRSRGSTRRPLSKDGSRRRRPGSFRTSGSSFMGMDGRLQLEGQKKAARTGRPNPARRETPAGLECVLSTTAAAGDHRMSAAVLPPAALFGFLTDGPLLAVADRAQAVGGNSQGYQVILGRPGSAFAEGQVVLVGATFVTMPFDGQRELRALLQKSGALGELIARLEREAGP